MGIYFPHPMIEHSIMGVHFHAEQTEAFGLYLDCSGNGNYRPLYFLSNIRGLQNEPLQSDIDKGSF